MRFILRIFDAECRGGFHIRPYAIPFAGLMVVSAAAVLIPEQKEP